MLVYVFQNSNANANQVILPQKGKLSQFVLCGGILQGCAALHSFFNKQHHGHRHQTSVGWTTSHSKSGVAAKYWVTFTVPNTVEVLTIKLRFVEFPCPYWLAGRTKNGAFVLFCNHPENYFGGMQLFVETGTSDEFIESKTSVTQ